MLKGIINGSRFEGEEAIKMGRNDGAERLSKKHPSSSSPVTFQGILVYTYDASLALYLFCYNYNISIAIFVFL